MRSFAERHAMLIFAMIGVVSTLAMPLASADEAEARKARAKTLFESGLRAIANKDFVEGCAQMRESARLFVVANSLFQVAMCEEREMKLASALREWKRGEALVDKTDPRAIVATKKIDALEKRVPRVRIIISEHSVPAAILIDDREIPASELAEPVAVDPGRHVITVRKSEHKDKPFYLILDEGQRSELQVEAGPPLPFVPKKTPTPEVKRDYRPVFRSVAFVAAGVGALGFIGATITGGIIASNDTAIDEKCGDKVCNIEIYDLVNEQRTLLPVNTAMWVTTGIGLSTATVFYLLSRSGANKTPKPGAFVFPFVLPHGGALGVGGRF